MEKKDPERKRKRKENGKDQRKKENTVRIGK